MYNCKKILQYKEINYWRINFDILHSWLMGEEYRYPALIQESISIQANTSACA